jgi:acetylornithine deacetylase
MSDQALLNCPSVKFAPGESCRSHTADEFIRLKEIETGIAFFIRFFNTFTYDQTWQDQFRFINAN